MNTFIEYLPEIHLLLLPVFLAFVVSAFIRSSERFRKGESKDKVKTTLHKTAPVRRSLKRPAFSRPYATRTHHEWSREYSPKEATNDMVMLK
jgi:hypothetical protein